MGFNKMRQLLVVTLTFLSLGLLTACSEKIDNSQQLKPVENNSSKQPEPDKSVQMFIDDKKIMDKNEDYKIKISVAGKELSAILYNNPTSKAIVEKLPLTVTMSDLYNREMAYFFPDELPTDKVETTGYEVGEIIYWPPRNTLVIMYAQNGERFGMQKVGVIGSGVEVFESTGDTEVSFEWVNGILESG